MPQFALANYIALRAAVHFARRFGAPPAILDPADDALAKLRRFFPTFEKWEREQADKESKS